MLVFSIAPLLLNSGCDSGNVTITYNANGGNISPSSEVVPAGSVITLPLPTFENYIFTGWCNQAGMKIGSAGSSYVANETVTLYAQWTPSGWIGTYLLYAYERGISRYYVDYEIHYYVNNFLFDTYHAVAYFDSYATAWAFSRTGGADPTPYYEEVWIDNVNRWWVADAQENYEVLVFDHNQEEWHVYYVGNFPGTEYADPHIIFTVDDFSTLIVGVPGPATIIYTYYPIDPGYLGAEDIEVIESWWTSNYVGWVNGIPDIYVIRIVPTTGIIYDCR